MQYLNIGIMNKPIYKIICEIHLKNHFFAHKLFNEI